MFIILGLAQQKLFAVFIVLLLVAGANGEYCNSDEQMAAENIAGPFTKISCLFLSSQLKHKYRQVCFNILAF